ncbi:MAG: response regulator transcription factor [Actinomycetia bacterium]|nr:response regulator transcription factor [Actinomycetes bacterium]
MSVRVLLVDDDPLVCRGLELLLSSDATLSVVGTVHDGDAVIDAVHRHFPDVILMDVRMERQDGITTTASLAALPQPPKVIVLTTFDHDDILMRALDAGAAGFLLKTASPHEIIAAVHNVASGEGALSPRSARQVVEHLQRDDLGTARRSARDLMARLTPRELDVVRRVAAGQSNPQIAAALFLGEATVKSHLASAQGKLGARNRVQVGVLVAQAGLLDPEQ